LQHSDKQIFNTAPSDIFYLFSSFHQMLIIFHLSLSDGAFDENIADNVGGDMDDGSGTDGSGESSSLQHMLAAIQSQEQKHKQQTKTLQTRIAQVCDLKL
jgi:hypothetical protein